MKMTVDIEGMTCASCAYTVKKSLEKDGFHDVQVDYASGEASFVPGPAAVLEDAFHNIGKLGYHVQKQKDDVAEPPVHHKVHEPSPVRQKFLLSLAFTLPVVLHMVLDWPLLHSPLFQLIMSVPVMLIGWIHFGRSAFHSLRLKTPNMDVLIALGSSAAFIYSVAGMILFPGNAHRFLFFETGDTIITLVLLGNLIEQRSVKQTGNALQTLTLLQPDKARLITEANGQEEIRMVPGSSLLPGQICLVNTGERIPADGTVTWGNAETDESMMTGESLPIEKKLADPVTGGTSVVSGSIKVRIDKTGHDTYLAQVVRLVREARRSQPAIQRTGDKISAVFVPVILVIAMLTFLCAHFLFHLDGAQSMLQAIAVLVIACPCAMGLATPTAVMVGLSRAAKQGILVKGGAALEKLAAARILVLDKTGTLTTGRFKIKQFNVLAGSEEDACAILYSLEKHSGHPLARAIVQELEDYQTKTRTWKKIEEDKGVGIHAWDGAGNLYSAGSFQMVRHLPGTAGMQHNIYLLVNNQLVATVDMADEVKPGTAEAIATLKRTGLHPVMVSGDRRSACEIVAAACGIDEFYAEQMPAQKLALIEKFSSEKPTVMVGDGINDAPALARAGVGVSMSEATQVAMQSAQVILVPGHDLAQLADAVAVSRHTLTTIRQNLFWALAYNVIAIPFAAFGWLSPMLAAFSMAFSDVVVIGNSLRLMTKKIF